MKSCFIPGKHEKLIRIQCYKSYAAQLKQCDLLFTSKMSCCDPQTSFQSKGNFTSSRI